MAIYYRILKKHHITEELVYEIVRVIRESFVTVAHEFNITEGTFSNFGAFYSIVNLYYDISHGLQFIGAYDKEMKELLGVVGVKLDKDKCTIQKLSVKPGLRHLGIGRHLMFEAECMSQNYGVDMSLGMIYNNQQLYEWYLSLGFKLTKVKPYKQTGLKVALMVKKYCHLVKRVETYKYGALGTNIEALGFNCNHRICLIYSQKEVLRETNTGHLVQKLLPNLISEFIWSRNSDDQLESYINKSLKSGYRPVLVYVNEEGEVSAKDSIKSYEGPKMYIILDATWQEASQIYNQSHVLQNLPILTLTSDYKSKYNLRKNQVSDGYCTAEVVGLVLEKSLEGKTLEEYTKLVDYYISNIDIQKDK